MCIRDRLSEAERETHPARFCLAEVCSIRSAGLRLAPAHRLVMGVQGLPLLAAFRSWCAGQSVRLEESPVPGCSGRLDFVYGAWQRAVWPCLLYTSISACAFRWTATTRWPSWR